MATNPSINYQGLHSLVKSFIGNYKEIKKWLGNTKKVLVVGTKPTEDTVPFSLCVRAVLEADGKEVEYIDKKSWYDAGKIRIGLMKGDVKTLIVENSEKDVSQLPGRLAKDIIERSEYYNPNNFKYVNRHGVFSPDQTFSLYLSQSLSRKYLC